jgi:hypothetical protein
MSADVKEVSVPTTLIGKSAVYVRIAISDQRGHSGMTARQNTCRSVNEYACAL